jgi:hypothetical protein
MTSIKFSRRPEEELACPEFVYDVLAAKLDAAVIC